MNEKILKDILSKYEGMLNNSETRQLIYDDINNYIKNIPYCVVQCSALNNPLDVIIKNQIIVDIFLENRSTNEITRNRGIIQTDSHQLNFDYAIKILDLLDPQ